jgi:hypothetical protein
MNKSALPVFCIAFVIPGFSKAYANPYVGSFVGYLESERYD